MFRHQYKNVDTVKRSVKLEKPILFNTEMVQAILQGRKTFTRRVIKEIDNNYGYLGLSKDECCAKEDNTAIFYRKTTNLKLRIKMPYRVGDILYVRETWRIQSMKNYGKRVKFLYKAEYNKELREVSLSESRYDDMIKYSFKNGWQPSLFMPKEAARIFLEVIDVRVERLRDIKMHDAEKEGIIQMGKSYPLTIFKKIWNSTVNKKDINKYGWDVNPWVWVIEFKVKEVKM